MPRAAELSFKRSQWGALSVRELLIDGRTIPAIFAKCAGKRFATLVSPLGWLDAAGGQVSLARFLPEGPADFSNGHRAILVCRECGDFGCGALTVRVLRCPTRRCSRTVASVATLLLASAAERQYRGTDGSEGGG